MNNGFSQRVNEGEVLTEQKAMMRFEDASKRQFALGTFGFEPSACKISKNVCYSEYCAQFLFGITYILGYRVILCSILPLFMDGSAQAILP